MNDNHFDLCPFDLYQGKGLSIAERKLILPKFTPLFDAENPKFYIAREELRDAVNVALTLGQPIILTGEPGTGKTQLAASIARELGLSDALLKFYTKTTSNAADLFYYYDALSRFYDAHVQNEKAKSPYNYIRIEALGIAVLLTNPQNKADKFLPEKFKGKAPTRSVVLIDEIDKAPRDFPNDLLNDIENMEFSIRETGDKFKANNDFRPIIVLTSNSERNLPDAFLRRCVFYHISFPDNDQLKEIIQKRFAGKAVFSNEFLNWAIEYFGRVRKQAVKKKPATAEFIAWAHYLKARHPDADNFEKEEYAALLKRSLSILLKTKEDLERVK